MANLNQYGEYIRQQVLLRETEVQKALVSHYGRTWMGLRGELLKLWAELAKDPTKPLDWKIRRLLIFTSQLEKIIDRLAPSTEKAITQAQIEAIKSAQDTALTVLERSLGPISGDFVANFHRLPVEATEYLVGFLADGAPLHSLFTTMGREASEKGQEVLVSGLIRGAGGDQIAKELREVTGQTLERSLRIARTEILRAHRESARLTMMENDDLVQGWVWYAHRGPRSCPACIAMHGTFHPLDQNLNDHVSGRCVAVPWAKNPKDLGYPESLDSRPTVENGDTWFARQGEKYQRDCLGKEAFEAYKNGEITLRDMVEEKKSPAWGTMRDARSLKSAREIHGRPNPAAGIYANDIPGL